MENDTEMWGTGVPCEECDSELSCYLFKLETKKLFAIHHYYCKNCKATGPWTALAIRKVGVKSAYTNDRRNKRRTFK